MKYEKPPAKLYRYEKVTHYSLGNLANSAFWFAPPASFNDPFDCSLFVQSLSINEMDALEYFDRIKQKKIDKLKNQMLSKPGPQPDRANLNMFLNEQFEKKYSTKESKMKFVTEFFSKQTKEKQEEYLFNKGVICFSEVHDDIMMWSHYADGHKGFCLELDMSKFSPKRNELFYKVQYCEAFPVYDPLKIAMHLDNDLQLKEALPPIVTKSKRWEYEREWRLIHNRTNWIYIHDNAVSAVYLGAKISNSNRLAIDSICSMMPNKPKLYQAELSNTEYSLEFSEITHIPINEGDPPR